MQWDFLVQAATVIALIAGAALAFRAILKCLEWRDGDKDAFWNFLALCCGAGSGIFFFIGLLALQMGPYANIEIGLYMGSILALAGMAFTFLSVFFKWRESK